MQKLTMSRPPWGGRLIRGSIKISNGIVRLVVYDWKDLFKTKIFATVVVLYDSY